MSFLSRILGYVPSAERRGIQLEDREPWRIEPTKDAERFLRALAAFAGPGTFVYFEDTVEPHVRDYLRGVSVEPATPVQMGTIWPRPDCHHVPLTADAMESLASFLERHPAALVCIHLLVYREGAVLLEWYDAFHVPLHLARSIDEPIVADFAATLGSKYAVGW